MVKNRYWILLMSNSLNEGQKATCFTKRDLINVNDEKRIWETNKSKIVFESRYTYYEYQLI